MMCCIKVLRGYGGTIMFSVESATQIGVRNPFLKETKRGVLRN